MFPGRLAPSAKYSAFPAYVPHHFCNVGKGASAFVSWNVIPRGTAFNSGVRLRICRRRVLAS